MHSFTRGQKGKLADLGLGARFEVGIDVQAAAGAVDISCFGLDADGRLASRSGSTMARRSACARSP
jgi:tellurite resistance protein TerA